MLVKRRLSASTDVVSKLRIINEKEFIRNKNTVLIELDSTRYVESMGLLYVKMKRKRRLTKGSGRRDML